MNQQSNFSPTYQLPSMRSLTYILSKEIAKFKSLAINIETLNDIPSTPTNLTTTFLDFINKYHELQLQKYIGYSKSK